MDEHNCTLAAQCADWLPYICYFLSLSNRKKHSIRLKYISFHTFLFHYLLTCFWINALLITAFITTSQTIYWYIHTFRPRTMQTTIPHRTIELHEKPTTQYIMCGCKIFTALRRSTRFDKETKSANERQSTQKIFFDSAVCYVICRHLWNYRRHR